MQLIAILLFMNHYIMIVNLQNFHIIFWNVIIL